MATAFRLERLGGELSRGTTPPAVFNELHGLFQFLASVISARIEGNHTTLVDAMSGMRAAASETVGDQIHEIVNVTDAMDWVDRTAGARPITQSYVRELHQLVVRDLVREGDTHPGRYRRSGVSIAGSAHVPPPPFSLNADMDDFVEFINRPVPPQFQLIQTAIAHHRFVWIHPFGNGNGRVSRLLSYAMLGAHGFVSPAGMRAVNPTSVFGVARSTYYDMLAGADDLSERGVIVWCQFFLDGLLTDMERAHQLQDIDFVRSSLVEPALTRFVASGVVTARERDALSLAFRRGEVRAGDLRTVFPGSASVRSQAVRPLVQRKLLVPETVGGRIYHLAFAHNDLTPFIVRQLDALGFLPPLLQGE